MGRLYSHLVLTDRIEIYRLRSDGQSLRTIAAYLGRSVSTISRELGRNSGDRRGRHGSYDPVKASRRSWLRRRMHRRFKLARQPELRQFVRDQLAMGWSPEQISGWLALVKHPMRISHESIYRYIYHRTRHEDYWHKLLPIKRHRRGFKKRRPGPLGTIKNRQSLAKRCSSANSRQSAGHWEVDLMCFSKAGPVLLIAHERHSRYTLATYHPSKTSQPLMETLYRHINDLPQNMRQTATFDNGTEFANHLFLKERAGMKTYFCDPRSPWQKGGVENAILRLRRWLPRKTNIETFTKRELDQIIQKYNSTPRKCLGYKTPNQAFEEAKRVALRS